MFRGEHPELGRVLGRALALARDLGHPRVGSEHLLLALTTASSGVATCWTQHGATEAAIRKRWAWPRRPAQGQPPTGTPWPR